MFVRCSSRARTQQTADRRETGARLWATVAQLAGWCLPSMSSLWLQWRAELGAPVERTWSPTDRARCTMYQPRCRCVSNSFLHIDRLAVVINSAYRIEESLWLKFTAGTKIGIFIMWIVHRSRQKKKRNKNIKQNVTHVVQYRLYNQTVTRRNFSVFSLDNAWYDNTSQPSLIAVFLYTEQA